MKSSLRRLWYGNPEATLKPKREVSNGRFGLFVLAFAALLSYPAWSTSLPHSFFWVGLAVLLVATLVAWARCQD